MKLVYATILLSLVFSSCKKKESTSSMRPPAPPVVTEPPGVPISTDFTQFKNRFLSFAVTKGTSPIVTNLTIAYSTEHTTADGVLGVCTTTSGVRDVTINRIYWEAWAANGKREDMEQLMFHELGHCTLSRSHFNTNTNGIAQSIMNAYHVNKVYYLANYNYYIDELFTPTLAGTVALSTSGTSGFDGSIYTSRESASTYTMTVSSFYDNHYQDNPDTNLEIEDFRCDEE